MHRPIEDPPEEYPTPKDVFRVALKEMLVRGARSWCHFADADSSAWAEVTPNGRGLYVKLSCPQQDWLGDLLIERVLSGSRHWPIVEFRRKGLLSQGRITYRAPRDDLDRIVAFIDDFFVNTCPKGRSYRVLGSVQS
jgi:hypothetical protein